MCEKHCTGERAPLTAWWSLSQCFPLTHRGQVLHVTMEQAHKHCKPHPSLTLKSSLSRVQIVTPRKLSTSPTLMQSYTPSPSVKPFCFVPWNVSQLSSTYFLCSTFCKFFIPLFNTEVPHPWGHCFPCNSFKWWLLALVLVFTFSWPSRMFALQNSQHLWGLWYQTMPFPLFHSQSLES